MTSIITWLTTYAAHVDGHHRAQLLAAADEIANLRAQVAELQKHRKVLEGFAAYGTRHDTNPTRRLPLGTDAADIDAWWLGYFNSADRQVRDIATRAISATTEAPHAISAVTGQTLAG